MVDSTKTPPCPFCGAPWTEAMLDALERHSGGASCGCCAPPPRIGKDAGLLLLPAHDLCCGSCGKAIYRALARTYSSSIIATTDAR